jgi:hypothetical protein
MNTIATKEERYSLEKSDCFKTIFYFFNTVLYYYTTLKHIKTSVLCVNEQVTTNSEYLWLMHSVLSYDFLLICHLTMNR